MTTIDGEELERLQDSYEMYELMREHIDSETIINKEYYKHDLKNLSLEEVMRHVDMVGIIDSICWISNRKRKYNTNPLKKLSHSDVEEFNFRVDDLLYKVAEYFGVESFDEEGEKRFIVSAINEEMHPLNNRIKASYKTMQLHENLGRFLCALYLLTGNKRQSYYFVQEFCIVNSMSVANVDCLKKILCKYISEHNYKNFQNFITCNFFHLSVFFDRYPNQVSLSDFPVKKYSKIIPAYKRLLEAIDRERKS